MRILFAGLLGAIAMFVWSAVAHMATPLATIGISRIPQESVVLDGFKSGMELKSGLYFFPWVDPNDPKMTEKSAELMKTNPNGILIYHPPGGSYDMTPLMMKEFAKELAQSLIAAFLLSLAALAAYTARVGFVFAIGVFAALGTDTSYWIWYGFPLSYTLATVAIALGEALIAGLVIAAIVRPRPAALT